MKLVLLLALVAFAAVVVHAQDDDSTVDSDLANDLSTDIQSSAGIYGRRRRHYYVHYHCRLYTRVRKIPVAYYTNHCSLSRRTRRVKLNYRTTSCSIQTRMSRRKAYYYTNACSYRTAYKNVPYTTRSCSRVRRYRRYKLRTVRCFHRGEEMNADDAVEPEAPKDRVDSSPEESLAALKAAEKSDVKPLDATDEDEDDLAEADAESDIEASTEVGWYRRKQCHVYYRYLNLPYLMTVCRSVRRYRRVAYRQRVCKRVRRSRYVNHKYKVRVCKPVTRTRYVNKPFTIRVCRRVRRTRYIAKHYRVRRCTRTMRRGE